MQRAIHKGALLAGAIATTLAILMAAPAVAFAHSHPHPKAKARTLARKLRQKPVVRHATVAITYTGEASKKASVSNSGFWLNGGSVDGAATLYRGFGLASNLSLVHARDTSAGTSVGKTTIAFGPRYTKDVTDLLKNGRWIRKGDWFRKMPPSQIFAEALFGVAHGFDSGFPEGTSVNPNANSGALQLGVGVDVTLWKHFGARVFELDYIRTALPNGAANSQNDLRLSFGVNYIWNTPTPSRNGPVATVEVPAK